MPRTSVRLCTRRFESSSALYAASSPRVADADAKSALLIVAEAPAVCVHSKPVLLEPS